jgi:hypothetical protein
MPLEFTKIESQSWRRNQDITNVDPGNPTQSGEIVLSGSFQFATEESDNRIWKDTIVNSEHLETITSHLSSRILETRNIAGLDIGYGIFDGISVGVNSDISFGEIQHGSDNLDKNTVDIGIYSRFCSGNKWGTIGFKPELLFSTINGETVINDGITTSKGNTHTLYATERITIFGRYTIEDRVNLFCGLQQKRVVYMQSNNKNLFENVGGTYFGISGNIKFVEPVVYVAIPIYSDYTGSTSPIQIGLKVLLKIRRDQS